MDHVRIYNQFLSQLEAETESGDITISQLTESVNCSSSVGTSINLKYSDEKECFNAIIKNFCYNYRDEIAFPKLGIDAITKITNGKDDVSKIRQILMIHASKAYFVEGTTSAACFFDNISTMIVDDVLSDQLSEWKKLAKKAITHPEITGIIDNLIQDYYQKPPIQPVGVINVRFVSHDDKLLRGFAGIGAVFFNREHFYEKLKVHEAKLNDVEFNRKVELTMKMDIIALAVHEVSHVRLRQVADNLNVSTPLLLKDTSLAKEELEFGRMTEKKVFGNHINWFRSLRTSDKNYLANFITAIENSSKLPNTDTTIMGGLFIRPPPAVQGFDMENVESFFE